MTILQGKGGGPRIIYATNGGKLALDAWLQVQGAHPGALLGAVAKGGRGDQSGAAMSGAAVQARLKVLAGRAGVASLSPARSWTRAPTWARSRASPARPASTPRCATIGGPMRHGGARPELLHVPYQAPAA